MNSECAHHDFDDTAAPKRIAIVDDDLDQASLLKEALQERFPNARIELAHCRADALKWDPSAFDVAIVDLNLPDGNGIDLMVEWRRTHDLPVVMITGERRTDNPVAAIRRGAADFVIKHGDYLDIVPIVIQKAIALVEMKRANRRLEDELRLRNKELERVNTELRRLATHDSLTGLYNRRHFGDLLSRLFAEAKRYGTDLTCMIIDVDDFKRVNDTRGHQAGDQVLERLARIIRESIRESDVPVRFGGDEFVILLPRTSPAEARASADRILARFQRGLPAPMPGACLSSLSIGLASREEDQPSSAETLVHLADKALYLAKSKGKGRVMVVRPLPVAH